MKKNIFSFIILAASAIISMAACSSEIPEGSADYFNSLPTFEERIVTNNYLPLKHPTMLHTSADIARVKGQLTASPWKEAYEHLCQSAYAQSTYTDSIPDPNEFLIMINVHQMANAAELLRDYSGWQSSDFQGFQNWMKNAFYSVALQYLKSHQGGQGTQHAWLNWDLASMTAVLSIGILNDDNYAINFAINYFKNEGGMFTENGNIKNAVPYIHDDPDSDEKLGQCEESGRDQGHAALCVALMGAFCQMAYNIGEDLFAYDNYRALDMAEYVAKYNLYTDEGFQKASNTQIGPDSKYFQYDSATFPYTAYSNPSVSTPKISESQRGTKRPAWELFYGYAKAHNVSAIYCQKWVEQMRKYNGYGDGGAGDYGPNSGGFDQLGYGTLMFAR